MAGFILMLPLPLLTGILILVNKLVLLQTISPLMVTPIIRWLDLVPAALGILGSLLYLHITNPNRKPETFQFWLAAMLPAVGLYATINLFPTLFDRSMRLPLSFDFQLGLPDIVIGIVIPIVLVLVVNIVKPVATNWRSAALFALPVFIIHVYYFVFSDWISPGISSLVNPGDTPGAGYQGIINGLVAGLTSLLLWLTAAIVSRLAAKTTTNLWRITESSN
jgi:hypothetical protein